MILLKGFYRKKTTKIYLLLFSILLITIVILFSFINYYIHLRDDYFKNNSYILVASKNDYYNDIIKQDIVKVEKVLLFKPDYSSGIIQKETLGEYGETRNDLLYWSDLIISNEDSTKEYILVLSKKGINDTEINIGVSSEKTGNSMISYNDKNIFKSLKNYNVSFYYESKKLEYTINNIYVNTFSEIQISSNNFQDLYTNGNTHAYKLTIGSKKKATQIIDNLQRNHKNTNDVFYLKKNIINTDSAAYKANQIIIALKYASIIIMVLLSLIFLVIINNIIRDEYRNIKIERLLGFKKQEIVKYLAIKLITLCMISFLICVFISSLIILLLNYIFRLELTNFNFSLLLMIISVIILLSILTTVNSIFKFNKYGNMKWF